MIKDNIKNYKNYLGISENLDKGFEYLLNMDFLAVDCGRYYVLDEKLFANVDKYKTKPADDGKFEAHKKYIDIQYIVKGFEKIGYGEISDFSEITKYDEKKDIVFLKEKNCKHDFIRIKEGDFAVFFPQDAHMPQISDEEISEIKKVVIKVQY